jgi:hypothetical protein
MKEFHGEISAYPDPSCQGNAQGAHVFQIENGIA